MSELKPCPFCGGAAHFFKITDFDDKNFGGEGICCGSCPITTDLMFSLMDDCKPKLAEAWNRRAQPAQAVPVLSDEELRDALRTCPHDAVENLRVRWLYAKDFARATEAAVRAKMEVAVPMTPFTQAQLERLWLNTPETVKDSISRPRFKKLVQFVEAAHGIVGKEGA